MPKSAKPDDPQAEQARSRNWRRGRRSSRKSTRRRSTPRRSNCWTKQDRPEDEADRRRADHRQGEGLRLRGPASQGRAGKVVYDRPAIEELIRWRLWDRTGGGLMAELGSHQLDAASIFIAAVHGGEKQHPLSVAAAGNRPLFPRRPRRRRPRLLHLRVPRPGLRRQGSRSPASKKIGVQYASINGNGFGGYGETVFGTEGTLLLETEKEAMLFKTHETDQQDEGRAGQERRKKASAGACRSTRAAIPSRRPSARSAPCRPNAATPRSWSIGPGASAIRRPENLPHCHPEGGPGRRGDRPDDQHGRPARARGSSSRRSGSTSTATKRPKA